MKNLKSPIFRLFVLSLLLLSNKVSAQWQPIGQFPDSVVFSELILTSAIDGAGNVYAAGRFTNAAGRFYVAKWNGTYWSPLGNDSTFNNLVLTVTTDAAGNVYAGGFFVNANGAYYVAKWDGTSWSEIGGAGTSTFNGSIRDIEVDAAGTIYAAGEFADTVPGAYVAKWDGNSWSEVGGANTSTFQGLIFNIAIGPNGNLYAAGQFFNNTSYYVACWNGTTWSELGGANTTNFIQTNYYGITALAVDSLGNVYAGGDFVNANGRFYVAKWNGTAWSELGGTGSSPFFHGYFGINTIKIDHAGNIYACGDVSDSAYYFFIAKWDGSTWSRATSANLPNVTQYGILNINFDNNGDLIASGDIQNAQGLNTVVKWNGTAWVELSAANASIISGVIDLLAVAPNGTVFEAGYNFKTGPEIRKWDGSSWSLIGREFAPINNTVLAMTTDPAGNLYIGGFFTTGFPSGGDYYVATYDDAGGWSQLSGTGNSTFNAPVEAMAADANGNLYVGGNFTNNPTFPSGNRYVAKWDGSTWSELGGAHTSTFNGLIFAIATDAPGNVYAAGSFTNGNGKFYVAKWNGSSWSELGGTNSSPFDSIITNLSVDGSGNVYATGLFTNTNGYKYVAKWDGTSWSEVGGSNTSSFITAITALAVSATGNVYVKGDFNSNGNQTVATWYGTAWSELGGTNTSPFNGAVRSLATDVSGNVYAGGAFTLPNRSYLTLYVAKYDVTTGINPTPAALRTTVFPNPASEGVVLRTGTDAIGQPYRIMDLFGRTVVSGTVTSTSTQIPLTGLSSGLYSLSISGTEYLSAKILKQ